jgi:Na+-transporting methylmalonyl-CoA/oxaloacetate decarboxylase gamma subunit
LNLDTVLQGLAISVVGMGLVFLALSLIVLAMVAMGRLFRPRPSTEDGVPDSGTGSEERAMVAAMVAATIWAGSQEGSHDSGGWSFSATPGSTSPWQASHRAQSLTRRP